ncbi:MAG: AI-2E family transporter, partial [Acinetobacter bohemicus]
IIVFMIGQAIEGYILQPFLLGDKIGLSPVAVVFAVLAGAQLAGFLGMLIALPVAAVIVVLLRHARECYEKSRLYDLSAVVIQGSSSGAMSLQTGQIEVDVEIQSEALESQQGAEKSSKIEPLNNKES